LAEEKIESSNPNGINLTVTFAAFRPDIEKYRQNIGTINMRRLLSNAWVKPTRFPSLLQGVAGNSGVLRFA
jgi:hypothetical protein